jgi:hypothetical protein
MMEHLRKIYRYYGWDLLSKTELNDPVPAQYVTNVALLDAAKDETGHANIKNVGYTYQQRAYVGNVHYIYVLMGV